MSLVFEDGRRIKYDGDRVNVTIPDGVTEIDIGEFKNCYEIETLKLSESLKSIGFNVFANCTGLREIIFPQGLTSIDNCAFRGCTGLVSVTFPTSLECLSEYAFENCTSLSSVTFLGRGFLPSRSYVFKNCPIGEVNVESVAAWLNNKIRFDSRFDLKVDGNLVTDIAVDENSSIIPEMAFYNCVSLKSVFILDGIKSIEHGAFKNCSSLVSVHLPESLESIETDAFRNCTALTEFYMPNESVKIEMGAFFGCKKLENPCLRRNADFLIDDRGELLAYGGNSSEVIIPDGVEVIGKNVFCNSTGITGITLPESVSVIKEDAFNSCTSLSYVNFSSGLRWIKEDAFRGCTGLKNVYFSDSLKWIESKAFSGCTSLSSVRLPDSLKSIGNSMFENCIALTSVDLPVGLEKIGDGAFKNCTSLTSISLPDTLTYIGSKAFFGCSGIESLSLPDSLTDLEYGAFYKCDALKEVEIPFWFSQKVNSVFNMDNNIKFNYRGEIGLIDDFYNEVVKKYLITMEVINIADDTGDAGMGYEWNKSYKKDYVPRKEDMVIQKGKLIGFTVEYCGERDVLYLEGDRSAYVEIQNTRRYQDYCIWTLKELKPKKQKDK